MNLSFSTKLDRTNFLIWHEQIISVIIAYGLENYIDRTQQPPAKLISITSILNYEFIAWNRFNIPIKSWIYGSVSVTMSSHLVQSGSSVDIWHKLETVFVISYGAHAMDLRLQLQTFRKSDHNIETYLMR